MSANSARPSLSHRLKAAYRIFRASGNWRPPSVDDLDRWMDAQVYSGGGETAMQFSAYFNGVMQISQSISSIAFPILKHTGPMRREPWETHPVHYILNKKFNPYVDAMRGREILTQNAINHGNGYARIERDDAFRPTALYPLDSSRMRVKLKDSGEPEYYYTQNNGNPKTYRMDEIFHLANFGPDPYTGYSSIKLHRLSIDLGLQQQRFSSNFIKNGVITSGVLTHPNNLSDKAHDNLIKSMNEEHAGAENAGSFLVLEEGMTFTPFSMPLKDAEFLLSKVFQIQEMARILNMPPHKLKEMSASHFNNIEHSQIEYVTDTIRPWGERWERAVDTQLLSRLEQRRAGSQHDLSQLLRGDMKTTMDVQRIARYAGLKNGNEARFAIGLNPIEDEEIGQRYWQPSNMMNAASEAARNGGGSSGGIGDAGGTEDENEEMVQDTE